MATVNRRLSVDTNLAKGKKGRWEHSGGYSAQGAATAADGDVN